MTSYEAPTQRPEVGRYFGFHHVTLWVGNAKQAAAYYAARFGFTPVAYRGLETGDRNVCSHVLRQGTAFFVFQSALQPGNDTFTQHLGLHGDGVQTIAFSVDDARGIYAKAMSRGAVSVFEPREERDEHGSVVLSAIRAYGDTVHVFVQNVDYNGPFLPNYTANNKPEPLASITAPVGLQNIDHIVCNQVDGQMEITANWYERVLDFHRFWSVDDKQMHTEYSALRSIVVADFDEVIKMPVNEPAPGRKKSQIQEFVEFYGGTGAQHIALRTNNIIESVTRMRERGLEFLDVPDAYYDLLRQRLSKSPVRVEEDIAVLQSLRILVDYDDHGYLLQIFTKPLEDRPTLFVEIIQRHNHSGFGAGNFKALFESIEREQALRGTL